MTARFDFASDNTAGAAPEALDSLIATNTGYAISYGADHVSKQAADLVRGFLDADADVRFVGSGTAANALALAAICRPFEAVLAHRHAHICTDETGAPGLFGHGLGLTHLTGPSGRIDQASLAEALAQPDLSFRQSPAALSLTQATEFGVLYSGEQIAALTAAAKAKGLAVHLDGARLANAVAAGFDPRSLKTLGIDILIIGGTKAGMTPSEAVVLLDPALSRRFDARLKQGGQLPSKSRFYSAPWIGMLESGAFIERARHANAMAKALAAAIPFETVHPVEANGVFVEMDEAVRLRLAKTGWFVFRFLDGSVRLMCSWATTPEAVEEIAAAMRSVL
ncbi:MAG: beta-eliminating lyase-related protein [Caulobacteraceae bacterium]|nr:beta-eliminating lyase-related protein [Caulobacteraceae bacterium]